MENCLRGVNFVNMKISRTLVYFSLLCNIGLACLVAHRVIASKSSDGDSRSHAKIETPATATIDYLQSRDYSQRKLNLIVQRLNLPISAAREVVSVQKTRRGYQSRHIAFRRRPCRELCSTRARSRGTHHPDARPTRLRCLP